MGSILIKQIKYEGEKYFFESPILENGLNIIEGDNGTGKTTFMNLIYFALGGNVVEFQNKVKDNIFGLHSEITNDENNFVELNILINNEEFVFKRYINSTDIMVSDYNEEVKIFPLNRSKNEKYVFSDWILEKLGINVVEVFQGNNTFKINFRDLLRLIYHDQEPNPRKIYKSVDFDNIIADSETTRKIIFQLLLGKTFSDYYGSLAKLKETEKSRNLAKSLLDEYTNIAKNISSDNDDLNLIFLNNKKSEKEIQLSNLYSLRDSIKENRQSPNNSSFSEINDLKSKILDNELKFSEIESKQREVNDEISKLYLLKESFILETTQIKKIIHSHEKLNLFSVNTCPYCLRDVKRKEGHCVCGGEVSETEYEKFFYNSEEYFDILKSKQKSVETINIAIDSCIEEKNGLLLQIKELKNTNSILKNKIKELISQVDNKVDLVQLNKIDDGILKLREEINNFNSKIEIEHKKEKLQKKYEEINLQLEELRDKTKTLEYQSSDYIRDRIVEFNEFYNVLMTNTLSECRIAKIDFSDYMPIINNTEYREASALVHIRLMYYITLLYMSITNNSVKFPKLLIIDTPETAGVDTDKLVNSIKQISRLFEITENFQIILSTAIDKYPVEFKKFVRFTLFENNRLLKKKNNTNL